MARFEEILILLNKQLVALTLGAVFVIVFVNVLGRYLLGVSLPWAEEVARHLMIFGAFAGAGLALREGRLVSIDTLLDALPHGGVARRAIRWGTVVLMAVFMVLLIWFGAQFVSFGWNKETMATQVPRGIPYLAIPIGAAIFLVHLALFARRFVAGTFVHSAEHDEV